MSTPREKLFALVVAAIDPAGRARLDAAISAVRDAAGPAACSETLLRLFPVARRRLGAERLAGAGPGIETADGTIRLNAWSPGDVGRAMLLLDAIQQGGGTDLVATVYRAGDEAERISITRALSLLGSGPGLKPLALQTGRTNSAAMFAALALDNPFPSAHYSDHEFNQLVLKLLFMGLPLEPVFGLAARANADLSRMCEDYFEERTAAGIVEPAFWQGQPRTQLGTFIDYYDSLVGWERFRASQYGIRHYCTIGLNPKESNDVALAAEVMKLLPRYCRKDGVVAIGEIGYDDMSDAEERFFAEQLELAKQENLPALVHTPHRNKLRGTERTIALVREVGIDEQLVIIDHLNEQTLPLVMETDCWRGHSIYPKTKMSEDRMVKLLQEYGTEKMVVNSAADWGQSDPLKVPKTGEAMRAAGFSEADIEKVLFTNPIEYFAQSGQITLQSVLAPAEVDQTQLYADNSILRGQDPTVE